MYHHRSLRKPNMFQFTTLCYFEFLFQNFSSYSFRDKTLTKISFLRKCLEFSLFGYISCSLGSVHWFKNLIRLNSEKCASFGFCFIFISLIAVRYKARKNRTVGQARPIRVESIKISTIYIQKKLFSLRSLIIKNQSKFHK